MVFAVLMLAAFAPGADDESPHRVDEPRRRAARGELSVSQALHLSAAGVPGAGVRLGHPDGVRGDPRRGAADRVGALRREHPVGDGVRHLVRDGRPRRRPARRREIHRDPVRRIDLVAQGVLYAACFLALCAGRAPGRARAAVLDRARRRRRCWSLYEFAIARHRDRDACFRAFLHNQWVGASMFAGIAIATWQKTH